MNNIYDCVDAFSRLLETKYKIIIARKGIVETLYIRFHKKDCFHLMGLQYLKDREELSKDRGVIFDAIKSRKIDAKHIEKSHFYDRIKERINLLPMLENVFDSNDTIFRYNSKQRLYSMIQADYLVKNSIGTKIVFVFLSKGKNDELFCRSFFAEDKVDYSENQPKWTLLYKEKINMVSGETEVLYDANCGG